MLASILATKFSCFLPLPPLFKEADDHLEMCPNWLLSVNIDVGPQTSKYGSPSVPIIPMAGDSEKKNAQFYFGVAE